MNSLFQTDGYKLFHADAYDKDIVKVYSNLTARSNHHTNVKNNDKVVSLGYQYLIKNLLIEDFNNNFFYKDKAEAVAEYKRIVDAYLGVNYDVERYEDLWELGYLPVHIKAIKEGTLVPYGIPMMTIENTLPGFQWLTNYLETVISCELWQIMTSATTSLAFYRTFKDAFDRTGVDTNLVPFFGHDFSFRGMPGRHAAAMSGFGHLATGFVGTDTIPAKLIAEKYYDADISTELFASSVKATEHSTMTSSILYKAAQNPTIDLSQAEKETFEDLFTKVPTGIVSVVSDSFDFWNVVENILPQLKDKIMQRNGKLVIRPDSGCPVETLCGVQIPTIKAEDFATFLAICNDVIRDEVVDNTPHGERGEGEVARLIRFEDNVYKVTVEIFWNRYDKQYYFEDGTEVIAWELYTPTVQELGLVESLYNTFGGTVTDKGYKLLDEHIGAIYGDSITHERCVEICNRLIDKGFCPTVVLGIGSYTFQYVTRDTHSFAVKATNVTVMKNGKGEELAIFKEPKTDSKKKSAKGLLRVVKDDNGSLQVVNEANREDLDNSLLQDVFLDGYLMNETSLSEIRQHIQSQI